MPKKHGSQQRVYLKNTQINEAYSFTWSLAGQEVDVSQFEDSFVSRIRGLRDLTGSISVWHDQDKQIVLTYANTRTTYTLDIMAPLLVIIKRTLLKFGGPLFQTIPSQAFYRMKV